MRPMAHLIPSMKGADGEDCVHFGEHIVEKFEDERGGNTFDIVKEDAYDRIKKALRYAPRIDDAAQKRTLQTPVEEFIASLVSQSTNVLPSKSNSDVQLLKLGQEVVLPARGKLSPRELAQQAQMRMNPSLPRRYNHLPDEAREKIKSAIERVEAEDESGT